MVGVDDVVVLLVDVKFVGAVGALGAVADGVGRDERLVAMMGAVDGVARMKPLVVTPARTSVSTQWAVPSARCWGGQALSSAVRSSSTRVSWRRSLVFVLKMS